MAQGDGIVTKRLVVICHCLEVLALAVWVGGLVSIIAAVIPAVFNTIGMEAGGRMLTRTFQGYDRLVMISAGVLAVGMLIRMVAAGSPPVTLSEFLFVGAMIAVTALLTVYLNPEVVRLQELAFGTTEAEAKRVAYENFFAYHRVARALYLVNLGLGITMLCFKVKRWGR